MWPLWWSTPRPTGSIGPMHVASFNLSLRASNTYPPPNKGLYFRSEHLFLLGVTKWPYYYYYYYGRLRQLGSQWLTDSCCYKFSMVMAAVNSFQCQLNSLGSIQPLIPSRRWKLFKHISNRCPSHESSPGSRGWTYRRSALPKDTAPPRGNRDRHLRPLDPKCL